MEPYRCIDPICRKALECRLVPEGLPCAERPLRDESDPANVTLRAARRRDSLYDQDAAANFEANREHLVRQTPVRWSLGQDPNDDEAWPDSGYTYYKLDHGPENPLDPSTQYKDLQGPDSEVLCFKCKTTNYRIIEERKVAPDMEVDWAIKNNRPYDPRQVPNVYTLFCPNCKQYAQLADYAMKAIRGRA